MTLVEPTPQQRQQAATTSQEPLATRTGMVRELVETAELYPLVFVVVADRAEIPGLQQMILDQAALPGKVHGAQVVLPSWTVRFGVEHESQVYRGTVPVFRDPLMYGRAA